MDQYTTRMRGAMGFPVEYELGRIVSGAEAANRRAILDGCKTYVVKLECAANGKTVGFFNGFMYSELPVIMTAGRFHEFNGADTHYAVFNTGTFMEKRFPLTLLEKGRYVRTEQAADNATFNVCYPDVSLFSFPEEAISPHPPRPHIAVPQVSDTAYVVGFKGEGEPQLSIFEGSVSCLASAGNSMLLTAYADNGLSGSPVFNGEGYVIGMVTAGHTTKQALALPAYAISNWLGFVCQPGFPG